MDEPVFTGLIRTLIVLAVIYLIGTLSTLFYNRLMVDDSAGHAQNHPGRDV